MRRRRKKPVKPSILTRNNPSLYRNDGTACGPPPPDGEMIYGVTEYGERRTACASTPNWELETED
jgi:hypothetical protein